MKIKISDADKLRGGYYTAPELATWLCNWAIQNRSDTVFEPSCGDGVFLRAAGNRLIELGVSRSKVESFCWGLSSTVVRRSVLASFFLGCSRQKLRPEWKQVISFNGFYRIQTSDSMLLLEILHLFGIRIFPNHHGHSR